MPKNTYYSRGAIGFAVYPVEVSLDGKNVKFYYSDPDSCYSYPIDEFNRRFK